MLSTPEDTGWRLKPTFLCVKRLTSMQSCTKSLQYFFHNCNRLFRLPRRCCTHGIAVLKMFRRARRSLCCSCQRCDPTISCCAWNLEWTVLCLGDSRTSRSTSWLCLYDVNLAVQLRKEIHQEFCNQRCCSRFPRAFLIRLVVQKMFLHPVHVDLVDQCSNSILVQPAVLSESSVPFGIDHPSSSCVPRYRCKRLVVCRRGRLHATLFGKNYKPFSWACFKLHQYTVFWWHFLWNNPWLRQIAWSFSHTISIIHRITVVKNPACLPL